jgi:hypothetical protein
MNSPDFAQTATGGAHMTTLQNPDGTWTVSVPIPGIQPVTAPTEQQAILEMTQQIQQIMGQGGGQGEQMTSQGGGQLPPQAMMPQATMQGGPPMGPGGPGGPGGVPPMPPGMMEAIQQAMAQRQGPGGSGR